MRTIVELDGRLHSAQQAAIALRLCHRLEISDRHIRRLTAEVGADLIARRDRAVERRRRRQLPPHVKAPPAVAVVEVDGGRVGMRQSGCGPGVHQPHYREDKVACLISMEGRTSEQDPQPEPPPSFIEPRRVRRLVQRIKAQATGEAPAEEEGEGEGEAGARPGPEEPWRGAPKPLQRTCVASMACSRQFGPMVAAEAQGRDFYRAGRGAFVADGQAYNWTIWRGYFRHFEPIADFLHVLCYVYLAAQAAGGGAEEQWSRYLRWLRACWQGRVREVLDELAGLAAALGPVGEGEEVAESDPREVVRQAQVYLHNNAARMDYGRYRRQGLPVTSSLVESLVGEFHARVKGPQKYWNDPEGAERILQVRAAVLSEDDRLGRYFAERPGNPYRRRKAG